MNTPPAHPTVINPNQVLVLGGGNFGTCLAHYLAEQGRDVVLWSIESDVVEGLRRDRRNPRYLSDFRVSPRVTPTSDLDPALIQSSSVVLLVVPTQALRSVLSPLARSLNPESLLVCAAKGIEEHTLMLPIDIIKDVLGAPASDRAVFLSGPSFAEEIMRRQPTAVSIAGRDPDRTRWAQSVFHAAHFRAYTSDDPIGLEVAGALKNVIAIAAGATQGIGYQANTLASLMTRGLGEMTRVGVALGANPITFNGLSGVGDLFLTCTSPKSRNYTVGFRLGRGESLSAILASVGSVAEGVPTARAAHELTNRLEVEAPIIHEVYRCLHEGKPITQSVVDLMTRDAKPEVTFPR